MRPRRAAGTGFARAAILACVLVLLAVAGGFAATPGGFGGTGGPRGTRGLAPAAPGGGAPEAPAAPAAPGGPPGAPSAAQVGPFLRIETGTHEAVINGLAVLGDGREVVTVSDDKTARVWTADKLDPVVVLRPPIGPQDEGALYAVATTGERIAVAGRTGKPGNYAIDLFARLPAAAAAPTAPASPEGGTRGLAPATPATPAPGAVTPAAGARPLGNISGLPQPVTALRFGPGGGVLAAGMQDGGLRLFDLKTQTALPSDTAYEGSIHGMDFDPSGRLAVAGEDGRVRLYAPDGKRLTQLALPNGAKPFGLAFAPDGRHLVVGDRLRPLVYLIDAGTMRLVRTLEGAPERTGGFIAVAYGLDGTYIVGAGLYKDASGQHYARSWAVDSRAAAETPVARDLVTAIALLPDGMVFTTAEPSLGRTDTSGAVSVTRAAHHINLRDAGLTTFRLSPDGGQIELPGPHGQHLVFDVPSRILELRDGDASFTRPSDTGPGVQVTDWRNSHTPRINGRPVALEPDETVRGVAVTREGDGVALGTDFFVRFLAPGGESWKQVTDTTVWAVNVTADGKHVVAGLADGTVHWYNRATGDEVAALFIEQATGRWALSTPEGFFDHDHPDDGSADGRTLIGYALNAGNGRSAEFIRIGQLYPSFFRPDMVGLSFRDTPDSRREVAAQRERIGPVRDVLARGLPPSLVMIDYCGRSADSHASGCPATRALDKPVKAGVMETSADQVLIDYRLVAPAPGQVGAVSLRRNEAVISPRTFTLEEDDKSRTLEATIPLGLGENVITLTPVTGNGQVEASADRRIVLRVTRSARANADAAPPPIKQDNGTGRDTGTTPPQPPPATPTAGGKPPVTLYMLSVGISKFQRPELSLDNAENDAKAVANLFNGPNPPVYDHAVVKTLFNEQATGPAISAALKEIAEKAGPDDLVLLFFAGHGQQVDGKYYYAPVDFGTHDDALFHRALAGQGNDHPLDELFRREGYGQEQMLPLVQSVQASKLVVVLDTCFSASIATQDAVLRRDANKTATGALAHSTGRIVLSSATALALDAGANGSLPSDGRGHGLFTGLLLAGLEGAADTEHSKRIDIYMLFKYIKSHMLEETKQMAQVQEPSFYFDGSDFFALRAVR